MNCTAKYCTASGTGEALRCTPQEARKTYLGVIANLHQKLRNCPTALGQSLHLPLTDNSSVPLITYQVQGHVLGH